MGYKASVHLAIESTNKKEKRLRHVWQVLEGVKVLSLSLPEPCGGEVIVAA